MASSIQILRSTNPEERPFPSNLLEGQPAVNLNAEEPGLFFKASDGSLIKIGPVAITDDGAPPNSGATGQIGNCVGELWLDKSLLVPTLKVFDGQSWVDAGSGSGGGGSVQILRRWVKTAVGGETTLSGPDSSLPPFVLNFVPGIEQVYINGVLLTRDVDYTTPSSFQIVSLGPLSAGDEISVLAWVPFSPQGPIDGSVIIDGSIPGSKLGSQEITDDKIFPLTITGGSIDDDTITDSKIASSGINSAKVYYTIGDKSRDLASKSADVYNVKDFGAVGDDIQNDTQFIQSALNTCTANGGGIVFVPPGIYRTTKPLIVRSNTVFQGSGAGSVIKTYGGGFPFGNAIHIGWGYEWDLNGNYFAPQWVGTDETISQLLANDYSNIKESNIIVRDFKILHTNNGGSIWSLNATDFLVENLWCENAQTPINIANDAGGWQGACARVTVRNIYQIGAGAWYDLLFGGSVVDMNISEMYTDPNSNSSLAESIVINGSYRVTISNCSLQKANGTGKSGIVTLGGFGEDCKITIEGNIVDGYSGGIVLFNNFKSICANNQIRNCTNGLAINGKFHLVTSNFFEGNTTDLSGNIDATGCTITNNRGLNTVAISGFSNPAEYNFFSGNNSGSSTFSSVNTYPALRSRKFVLSPIEAEIPSAYSAVVSKSLSTIILSVGTPVEIYFKIPQEVKRILSLTVYGFAAVSGETIDVSIVGQNTIFNGGVPQFESLGSVTTSGAGDFGSSISSALNLFCNGGYYLRLTLTFSSPSTQLRSVGINCLTDE